MTELGKLIKAAQAVIGEYSKHGLMMTGHYSGQTALANLRQAAEQAKGVSVAPVGYVSKQALAQLTAGNHASVRIWGKPDKEAHDDVALYTKELL